MALSRRELLQGLAAGAAAASIWVPNRAYAQSSGRGTVRHLIFVRLSGGFRFTAAFNGGVDGQYNPFGASGQKATGTEWSPSTLLERAPWLEGDANRPLRDLGVKPLTQLTNEICLLPCVDHEPFSGRADGNHGTALERYLTGYVGGATAFFSYVNHGLKARVEAAAAQGTTLLPAFSLGEAGMSTGAGLYAAYRAPVLEGEGFERFGFNADLSLPKWAEAIPGKVDERLKQRVHPALATQVEAYQQSRAATRAYGQIFKDPLLNIGARAATVVDGISNQELDLVLGAGAGRRAALALRLFHFGCPAVFFNEGGYDMHSQEDTGLPPAMAAMNRVLSGLHFALKKMTHPEGGTYWEKTLVVFGSEFGRTTGGQRFNSAGGSDHSSDLATRWMSMPMMGGVITAAGKGGKSLGETRASDLKAMGKVYSYRSVLKTMLDLLGAEHAQAYPADAPIEDLFA